jgi:hypothetical protein
MMKKIYPIQKWLEYLSVRNWWRNTALFTPLRYVRRVAVQLHSVLALALNGDECSTLLLTNSPPDKKHH